MITYEQAHETVQAWLDWSELNNLLTKEVEEEACDALAPYVVQFGAALQDEVGNGN